MSHWTNSRCGPGGPDRTGDGSARMEPAKDREARRQQHERVAREPLKPLNRHDAPKGPVTPHLKKTHKGLGED